MRSIVLALAATLFPLAAHAGENVTYTVDGEAFEGYRAKPTGASKGLVVIIHAWGGVTEYEPLRPVSEGRGREILGRVHPIPCHGAGKLISCLSLLGLSGQSRASPNGT